MSGAEFCCQHSVIQPFCAMLLEPINNQLRKLGSEVKEWRHAKTCSKSHTQHTLSHVPVGLARETPGSPAGGAVLLGWAQLCSSRSRLQRDSVSVHRLPPPSWDEHPARHFWTQHQSWGVDIALSGARNAGVKGQVWGLCCRLPLLEQEMRKHQGEKG